MQGYVNHFYVVCQTLNCHFVYSKVYLKEKDSSIEASVVHSFLTFFVVSFSCISSTAKLHVFINEVLITMNVTTESK